MKQIIPFLIIGFSFAVFLLLRVLRPLGPGKAGIVRRIWRKIVAVWDFITGFG
jgi:hypothetical protein